MRPIMSKADFLSILARQQQSELTIKDFCENEAYSVSCFHYWKSKYRLNRHMVPVLLPLRPSLPRSVSIRHPLPPAKDYQMIFSVKEPSP